MPVENRAAQFAPFAALSGHGEAIAETARQTSERRELTDEERAGLSRILQHLLETGEPADITFFRPDTHKSGGEYVDTRGAIARIDEYEQIVILADGRKISLDALCEVRIRGNQD